MKLNGSEKQVAWAQDILDNAEGTIKINMAKAEERLAQFPEVKRNQFEVEAYKVTLAGYEKMVAFFDGKPDNAKSIIERRANIDPSRILKQVSDLVNIAMNKGEFPKVK